MNREFVDFFGNWLMTEVRDRSIREWHRMIDGELKGLTAERVKALTESCDQEAREVMRQCVPMVVDTTLHYLLWALEETQSIDVAVQVGEKRTISIREESDGLAGELRAWIKWFSKTQSSA